MIHNIIKLESPPKLSFPIICRRRAQSKKSWSFNKQELKFTHSVQSAWPLNCYLTALKPQFPHLWNRNTIQPASRGCCEPSYMRQCFVKPVPHKQPSYLPRCSSHTHPVSAFSSVPGCQFGLCQDIALNGGISSSPTKYREWKKCRPCGEAILGPAVSELGQPCVGFCPRVSSPWLFPGFTAPSLPHLLSP